MDYIRKNTLKKKLEAFDDLKNLCSVLYHMVNIFFSGNLQNQLYSVQWMDVMIKHINYEIGSAFCLTELVEDNEKLLEEKVTHAHIKLFFRLIREVRATVEHSSRLKRSAAPVPRTSALVK